MAWDDEDLQRGPIPLWFQIKERLREAIQRGEFAPGDALPPESALNRRFGISRTTARAALDSLEHDGLVSRRSGHGSIVRSGARQPAHELLTKRAQSHESLSTTGESLLVA